MADADEIAALCYDCFQQLPRRGKPEPGREWTLLAAVVMTSRCAPTDRARSPQRLRSWMIALHLDPNTPYHRLENLLICSDHFVKEDYIAKTERTGSTRYFLKDAAVPSVGLPQPQTVKPEALTEASDVQQDLPVFKKDDSMEIEGAAGFLHCTPVKSPPKEERTDREAFFQPRVLLLTSPHRPGMRTKPSTSGRYLALAPSWRNQSDIASSSTTSRMKLVFPGPTEVDIKAETSAVDVSITSEVASNPRDSSFVASTHTSTSGNGSSSGSTAEVSKGQTGGWSERKWIVKESCLLELSQRCRICGGIGSVEEVTRIGSKIKVTWSCLNNHTGDWVQCCVPEAIKAMGGQTSLPKNEAELQTGPDGASDPVK